jgi:hypothetical protein
MARNQRIIPPTYEQAEKEYRYHTEKLSTDAPITRALYRKVYNPEYDGYDIDKSIDLLTLWPIHLTVDGRQWPFLKVVFLMANQRWPRGPVYYPHPPCDPRLIAEGFRPLL